MSISVVDKLSYTLYLNSVDRISGTNNNATFNINWEALLPHDNKLYKIIFTFQSIGGYYKDFATYGGGPLFYNSARIRANFKGKNFSLDSSSNGPSMDIGVISRDIQSATSSSNSFGCYYGYNPGKTISKPNENLTVQIVNNYTYSYSNNNYAGSINYLVGTIVYYSGFFYICILQTTGTQNPGNVTYWTPYTPTTTYSPLQLLCDTNSSGVPTNDMTAWTMIIEFIPID
jgi:hypothetical protein